MSLNLVEIDYPFGTCSFMLLFAADLNIIQGQFKAYLPANSHEKILWNLFLASFKTKN